MDDCLDPAPNAPCRWLEWNAAHHPEDPAWIDGQGVYSHLALYGQILSLARLLGDQGIRRGMVIAAACHSWRLLALLTHAVPMLGCTLQPLNPDLPQGTRTALLARTGATALITDTPAERGDLSVIDAVALATAVADGPEIVEYQSPTAEALTPDEVHLIVTTSGSTGEPKAVMSTGRNIVAAVAASRERIELGPGDRWLVCLPLYHIGGLAILHRCAQAGATAVLTDGFRAAELGDILHSQSCTHISLVPAMLARFLELTPHPPPDLRHVLIGGAALDPGLAQTALARGWPLCISYGMSETCSQVATLCHPQPDWPGQLVGKPLVGMQVRIDERSGCIRIRSDAVMAGYANPERKLGIGLTDDAWFETSDIGRLDENSCLWILGRSDHILISGGINVHPLQVETLMAGCPGIRDVAVTGQSDPVWGERLVALFVGAAEPVQVEPWCRAHLPSYLRPRTFIKVMELPRNAMGKLDRNALVAMGEAYMDRPM